MKKSIPKEVIVQRSAKILIEKGLKTTMDELSHLLKISKRTIYEQFEDKDDLVRECTIYLINILPPLPVIQRNIMNQIPNICQILIERIEPLFGKRAMFVSEIHKYYPELFDEYIDTSLKKMGKSFSDCLQKSMKEGLVRTDVDIYLFVHFLFRLSYTVNSFKDEGMLSKYSHENIFRTTIFSYLRGVFTEKGVELFDATIKNYVK